MDETTRQRLSDGEACLKAALSYLARGWSVLALCPPDHVGVDRVSKNHAKNCPNKGKRPWHFWKDYEDKLPTEADVRYWWQRLPNSNVGIALGPVSGLIRIDVEGQAGEIALARKSGGILPDTLQFRSGRKDGTGRGLLYAIPEGVRLRTTRDSYGRGQELRFQARGAQTVLPPSRHESGSCYLWVPGHSPDEIQTALAPPWLLAELADTANGRPPGRSADEWEEIFSGSIEGSRNDNAAAFIGKLLSATRDIENAGEVRAMWLATEAINQRNDPPLDDDELQTVFLSILKRERLRRKEQDADALDRYVSQQIDKAAEKASAPSDPSSPDAEQLPPPLPEWHLVIVQSDPVEYRLRSPFWLESVRLKDGYLVLTSEQILNWTARGDSIRRAALKQAQTVIPPMLKNWSTPGGALERLLQTADTIAVTPESQQQLYILGFVYRYLATARPPNSNGDGQPRYSPFGNPTRCEDGSVAFKLDNLKRKIADAHEDFGIHKVTRLLEENGLTQSQPDGTRWWHASPEVFFRIGVMTKEGNQKSDESEHESASENKSA